MPNKKSLTIKVIGLLLLCVGMSARAASMGLNVEPIIGYERVQKLVPTPHTHDRLTYGVRAILGVPLVAVEAEYLRGSDTETFPSQSLTTNDTDDKAKLGLRSTFALASLLSFHLRAGAQATQNHHSQTQSGVTTTSAGAVKYAPYAGAGASVRLTSHFSLNADVTTVFVNFPSDFSRNEYQTTAGFTVHFP